MAAIVWLGAAAPGMRAAADQDAAPTPGPQSAHSLAYDEQLRRVVLIGANGRSAMADAAEIWTWGGRRWERVHHPAPPRRSLAAAGYDSKRKRLVVFGGRVGREGFTKGDTWTWDGNTWRETTDTNVGIRNHHSMAYDETRGRMVMYGGITPLPNVPPLQHRDKWTYPAETWEWDGARWHRMPAEGPGSRNGTALAYDARRRNIVLFGGVGPDGVYRSGTWTWNGQTWHQAAVDGPPLRASHRMSYDSRAGVVLLYGGGYGDANRTDRFQDMWQWDGKQWTEIAMKDPAPGPRIGHAMAYDRSRGRLVLFGGFGRESAALGDTWEWDGTRWTEMK